VALVNIESVWKRIRDQFRKTPEHQGVETLSYKRNRGISLVRCAGVSVTVRGRGFCEREITAAFSALPKVLRAMMSTELPRNRKVRVYRKGNYR
jgi:hypothetical protein